MRPLKLHSSLAGPIQNFINLRRLSGTDYKSQAQLLGYFDRFLLNQKRDISCMTRQITDCYQQSLSHLTPRSRSNRFCVVRQLCEYLARNDPCSYVPEPLKTTRPKGLTHPISTPTLRSKGSWGLPLNCRHRTPFDLTLTRRFWDCYTPRESGSVKHCP